MSNYTFDNLVNSAERLNPKVYGRNARYVPKYEIASYTSGPQRGQKVIVPYVGTKSVLVSLRAWGVTQASIHNVTILFGDCDIHSTTSNTLCFKLGFLSAIASKTEYAILRELASNLYTGKRGNILTMFKQSAWLFSMSSCTPFKQP